MTIGIYMIKNRINSKKYIGQSINIEKRWKDHIKMSHTNIRNNHLYNALKKYGIENFDFSVLEECTKDELNIREKYWINYYQTVDRNKGYNATSGGDSHYYLRDESKQKISQTRKELYANTNLAEVYSIAMKKKIAKDDTYYKQLASQQAQDNIRKIKSLNKRAYWSNEENKNKAIKSVANNWKDEEYRNKNLAQRELAYNSLLQLTMDGKTYIFNKTLDCANWCIEHNICDKKPSSVTGAIRAHMRHNSRMFMGRNIQIRRIPKNNV
ncbi:hypothetical protein B5E87_03670 [Massilimicrobiota sp. An142]|uniref:GIY-YIG nuclease family protein n=2 Tax=Massilimicrobiota TaxID=1924110 RepID=UPI000B3A0200|nr:GIY-YIG nuclease family protein [Massilimicrobiota timonensis]OUQ14271.1 hypothetical protein B5E87_03670 [Massilimicrobiota sp. An142]